MKVAVFTLGCKVNECESRSIISELRNAGAEVTEEQVAADVYVVNTCSVTAEADRKSRQLVRKCSRIAPHAKIFVTGCSSMNEAGPFIDMPNVVYVGGTAGKSAIAQYIMSYITCKAKAAIIPAPVYFEEMTAPAHERTRDYIKIQDGCNNFCSYCVIPYLRGRCRSRSLASVISEAEEAAKHTKEIVLTGIDVSSYGKDIGLTLTDVVRALGKLNVRKRLSSFECTVICDELLDALAESGFNDHFHLSLQSGCDSVLKAMNRHYDCEKYMSAVRKIREYFPDAGITTDVIAGFPTETDRDFADTCAFVREVGFSDMHVFPYSERKGTRAAALPQVPMEKRRERAAELGNIKKELKKAFILLQTGKALSVYFEEIHGGIAEGYSANYVRVYSDIAVPGEIRDIIITRPYKEGAK